MAQLRESLTMMTHTTELQQTQTVTRAPLLATLVHLLAHLRVQLRHTRHILRPVRRKELAQPVHVQLFFCLRSCWRRNFMKA